MQATVLLESLLVFLIISLQTTTLTEILEGCKAQKPKYQRLLYEKYARQFLGICMRYAKDKMEAEDILIQSFTKIFKHIDTFREGSFEGWMKRICIRESINNFHKNKNQTWYNATEEDESLSGSINDILVRLNVEDIMKLVQTLPDGCKMIFNLYAIEGFTHKEIAEMLEISEGTSKSQYARAKSLLKTQLKAEEKWKNVVF